MKTNKKHTVTYTQNDFYQYISDKMSREQQHTIEAHALGDAFLRDALDGFQSFPHAIAQQNSGWKIRKWFLIIVVLLSVLFAMFFYAKKNTPEVIKASLSISSTVYKRKATCDLTIQQTEKPTLISRTSKKQDGLKEPKREYHALEAFSNKTIEKLRQPYTLVKPYIKTISYYNYIAVDYTNYLDADFSINEVLTGTKASKENKNSEEIVDNNIKKYSYTSYLELVFKRLSVKDYPSSTTYLLKLLETNPNDVNAQFYLGYIQYNQANFDKSITFFNQAIENVNPYFYEDAQWLKAKALKNQNRYGEAKQVLLKIIQEKGFYSKQANQILQKV